jgi:SAM-dependent methyltransferase
MRHTLSRSLPSVSDPDYWNHNVHYQPLILRAVPRGCVSALDVGCGDGRLVRRLAERCAHVTGIDLDARMIAVAKGGTERPGISFIEADFFRYPFPETFDFICANTTLHHMDFGQALNTIGRLLRPGGRMAVIGLARDASARDYLTGAAAIPIDQILKAIHPEGNSGAPVKDPDMTWTEVRATARGLLPGVRYRRHLLWRYSLLWDKPG